MPANRIRLYYREVKVAANVSTIKIPRLAENTVRWYEPDEHVPSPRLVEETLPLKRFCLPVKVRGETRHIIGMRMGKMGRGDGPLFHGPLTNWAEPIPDRIWRRLARIHPSTLWNRLVQEGVSA